MELIGVGITVQGYRKGKPGLHIVCHVDYIYIPGVQNIRFVGFVKLVL